MKIFISRVKFRKLDKKIIFNVEGINPKENKQCFYIGVILDENLEEFKDQLTTGVISFVSSKYEITTFGGKTFIKFIPEKLKAEHPLKKNGSCFVYAKNIYISNKGFLDDNKTYCFNNSGKSAFFDFMSKISICDDKLFLVPFMINEVSTERLVINENTKIDDDFLEFFFFSK